MTEAAGQARRRPSGFASGFKGYVVAMAVCLPIAALFVLMIPRSNKESVPLVNYSLDLASVRRAAPYEVYAPAGLPKSWRPTSTRVTGTEGKGPVSWHLGFATPSDEHAALEESNEQPDGSGKFISRMTTNGDANGTQVVAGATWERFVKESRRQRSLVRRMRGFTIVVTGTASYEELGLLAGSLQPQPKPTPSRT